MVRNPRGRAARERARATQRGLAVGTAGREDDGKGNWGKGGGELERAPLQLGYASSLRPHGYIYNPNCILPSAAVAVLLLYKSGFVYCDF